jgi:muramidase (phage lysozyme)
MTRDDLLYALQHNNVLAFLAVIRAGEGTDDDVGYRRHFGGTLFDSFADHPRVRITRKVKGLKDPITSTAAGAYQFLSRTWDEMAEQYGLKDFSPINQDCAAVGLIARRGALRDVIAGRFDEAIRRTCKEWASLPGSPYGQPVRTHRQALAVYTAHGGTLAA